MRRGFTLVELLVASGVFLFGFTAALGLFLIGTRARAQADGMLRLGIAASSLVEEIRLEAGREGTASPAAPSGTTTPPFPPSDYIGDGFAAVQSTDENVASPTEQQIAFYPYPLQPGIWYRVLACVDEKGSATDPQATALRFDYIVIWNPVPDSTLTLADMVQRQRLDRQTDWPTAGTAQEKLAFAADFMAKRGFAVRETAWIIRKPSWER